MYERLTEDIKIVSVEYADELIDIGAAACKALPPGRRYRYARKHIYTLENGQQVNGETHGETKPKLVKSMERELKYIAEGYMFASQYSMDGIKNWSIVTKICIGLR
jgi:hypothetical protein